MHFKEKDAQHFTIPGGTNGILYPPSPKGDQSFAVVVLDGRYPEKGYSINDICTETLYVFQGSLKLEANGVSYTLEVGDLFMILPETKYRLSGKGKAGVIISPSWDSNQNHIIE